MRRVIDRALTVQAATGSGLTRLNMAGQIVAPEVVGLAFEYFDGTLWTTSWDSDLLGELPLAVRVTLEMLPVDPSPESGSEPLTARFEHVIRLPMAKIPSTTTGEAEAETSELDSSVGDGATSGSTGAGNGI